MLVAGQRALFVQRLGLRPRRHLRPDRAVQGDGDDPLPRPQPPPARRSCRRRRARFPGDRPVHRCPRTPSSTRPQPWRLKLLVQRAIGALEKAFLTFDLGYQPPDKIPQAAAQPPRRRARRGADGGRGRRRRVAGRTGGSAAAVAADLARSGWSTSPCSLRAIWRADRPVLLPGLARAPPAAVRPGPSRLPRLHAGLARLVRARRSCRWSTCSPSPTRCVTDFRWDYFLMDPLIFILWCSRRGRAAVLGPRRVLRLAVPVRRAAGADQPASASRCSVPQLKVPFGVHERLWPIKYIIFLVLFGLSLYSLAVGRALCRGRAVQDRDRPALRPRLAVRALRGRAAGGRPVHRAVLLPLPVPARRGAGHSRPAADVRLAASATANAATRASAAPTSARSRRSTRKATSTPTNASTACTARCSTTTTTNARS